MTPVFAAPSQRGLLRRDNGSELQVLRVIPGKGVRGVEKTRLDLKDYARVECPLPENIIDILKDDLLPKHQFHPMIPQAVLGKPFKDFIRPIIIIHTTLKDFFRKWYQKGKKYDTCRIREGE